MCRVGIQQRHEDRVAEPEFDLHRLAGTHTCKREQGDLGFQILGQLGVVNIVVNLHEDEVLANVKTRQLLITVVVETLTLLFFHLRHRKATDILTARRSDQERARLRARQRGRRRRLERGAGGGGCPRGPVDASG